jgi:hypothetical protein
MSSWKPKSVRQNEALSFPITSAKKKDIMSNRMVTMNVPTELPGKLYLNLSFNLIGFHSIEWNFTTEKF